MGIKWIAVNSKIYYEDGSIGVWFQSDRPIHLYLIYSLFAPIRSAKWIIDRGMSRPCGFIYTYRNTICLNQTEPGDSYEHHWYIPAPVVSSKIYFFIAEDCTYIVGSETTPPMTIQVNIPPCLQCDLVIYLGPPPLPPRPLPQIITATANWY